MSNTKTQPLKINGLSEFKKWFRHQTISAHGNDLDKLRTDESFDGGVEAVNTLMDCLDAGIDQGTTFDAICSAVVTQTDNIDDSKINSKDSA